MMTKVYQRMINCDDSWAHRIILCGMKYLEPCHLCFPGFLLVSKQALLQNCYDTLILDFINTRFFFF